MRDEAQAVVIGGGVGGTSILYHLARLGWKDVVLVEQYGLTHGSTWHSAGLVGQLRSTVSLTKMMQYSVGLYADLAARPARTPAGTSSAGCGWRRRASATRRSSARPAGRRASGSTWSSSRPARRRRCSRRCRPTASSRPRSSRSTATSTPASSRSRSPTAPACAAPTSSSARRSPASTCATAGCTRS